MAKFDNFVGRGCRQDLRKFTGQVEKRGVYIHSSPKKRPFHFDIMVPFEYEDGKIGIFFVGFLTNLVSHVLNKMAPNGHSLFLILDKSGEVAKSKSSDDRKPPYLIEVSENGARDVLKIGPWLDEATF